MSFPTPAERSDWFSQQYECSLPDAQEASQPQEVPDTTEESVP